MSVSTVPFHSSSAVALMATVRRATRLLSAGSRGHGQVRPAAPARDEVLRVPATVEAPAQARRFVGEVLGSWGCDQETQDDLVLVVSELVSEATRYALAAHVEVQLTRRYGRLELAVSDACPEPPTCIDERSGAASLVRAVLDSCSEHWDWSVAAPAGRTVRAYVAC